MAERTTVRDLMTVEVVFLTPNEELELAEELMRYRRVRHLPVIDEGKLVGLISHRDLLRAQARLLRRPPTVFEGDFCPSVYVREFMTTGVRTVGPDAKASDAAKILLQNRFGCLPVVDESDHILGIVTEVDFLRWAVERLEQVESPARPDAEVRAP
jgi:CBS domain-containing membrane protein